MCLLGSIKRTGDVCVVTQCRKDGFGLSQKIAAPCQTATRRDDHRWGLAIVQIKVFIKAVQEWGKEAVKCWATQGESIHSISSASNVMQVAHSCTYEYDYFGFGLFLCLFSHELMGLNKNELKWKPVSTAIWYINYLLKVWTRIALAKFPQFLHSLCRLHVKHKAADGLWFYSTRRATRFVWISSAAVDYIRQVQ